jgi:hypothetical protein
MSIGLEANIEPRAFEQPCVNGRLILCSPNADIRAWWSLSSGGTVSSSHSICRVVARHRVAWQQRVSFITAASFSPRPGSSYVFLYSTASHSALSVPEYSLEGWNQEVCVRTHIRIYEGYPNRQDGDNRDDRSLPFVQSYTSPV